MVPRQVGDGRNKHRGRMQMISQLGFITTILLSASTILAAEAPNLKLDLPKNGSVKVAFVISNNATLIDIAGPMKTFDEVQTGGKIRPFETFTVSETKEPIKAGSLTVIPDYTFSDAP